MSTDQTTTLGLPFLMPAQAQKHVTVNESLTRLDALVQMAVESRTTSSQPGSPADGAVWIAPAGKTGAEWGGYGDWSLAYFRDGSWEQITPKEGWRAWVKDEDCVVAWTGAAWSTALAATSIELGHASDTTISRSAAGVLEVEGGVIPKENRANTYSLDQAAPRFISTTTPAADAADATFKAGCSSTKAGVATRANTGGAVRTHWSIEDATNGVIETVQSNGGAILWAGQHVWGGATGGGKGAGTINAKAVYDDNTLLSCYVFDAALDRAVDLGKWDGKVPAWVTPETWAEVQTGVRPVEVGREVVDAVERPIFADEPVFELVKVADATAEQRVHDGARRFAARLGTAHDPLTLDGYAAHWQEKRHLTSLPNEASFDPLVGLPTGAWVQRLVETVEIQAVLIEALNQRLKALEAVRPT
jgi:hypothetical protein